MGRRSASWINARRNAFESKALDDAAGDWGAVVEGAAVAPDVQHDFAGHLGAAAGEQHEQRVGPLLAQRRPFAHARVNDVRPRARVGHAAREPRCASTAPVRIAGDSGG